MISTEPSVQADFYFKKEQELDSDGNAIYALFSKKIDGSDDKEYANYIYAHIPENEDIDNLYFNIKNGSGSDNLYFELDKPLNLYFETVKGSLAAMDLKSKIEIAQDLKLYVKDFSSDMSFIKSYIGFYDDEKNPAHSCDNKLYCDKLAITNVENSSMLFKRGNYNNSDESLKNLNWRDTNGATYKIGGEYSFINISGYKPIASASSKQMAQVTVKFDNLSNKKATSLNVRDLVVVTDEDRRLELEIDSPAISLTDTTLEVNGQSWVKSRVLRDDHSITVNDTMITLNGTFESKSQSGLYISPKRDKKSKYKATLYFQGNVLVEAKGGSCFVEGKNTISESKVISSGTASIVDTSIVSSTVESLDSLLVEDVALKSSVVKGFKDSDPQVTEGGFVNKEAILRRAYLENIDLINPKVEYGGLSDSDSSFLLKLTGSLAANGLKVEDSNFYISDTCFTTLEVKFAPFSGPRIEEKEKKSDIIKSCSFNGGNTIDIIGPVDFSNTLFYNTTTSIDCINALDSSELSGLNRLALIEEPISNAILSNVEVHAVSGLSEHYIQNYKADGVKYVATNEEAKPIDATIKEEPELL